MQENASQLSTPETAQLEPRIMELDNASNWQLVLTHALLVLNGMVQSALPPASVPRTAVQALSGTDLLVLPPASVLTHALLEPNGMVQSALPPASVLRTAVQALSGTDLLVLPTSVPRTAVQALSGTDLLALPPTSETHAELELFGMVKNALPLDLELTHVLLVLYGTAQHALLLLSTAFTENTSNPKYKSFKVTEVCFNLLSDKVFKQNK